MIYLTNYIQEGFNLDTIMKYIYRLWIFKFTNHRLSV